jgi:hypothetical protein
VAAHRVHLARQGGRRRLRHLSVSGGQRGQAGALLIAKERGTPQCVLWCAAAELLPLPQKQKAPVNLQARLAAPAPGPGFGTRKSAGGLSSPCRHKQSQVRATSSKTQSNAGSA